MKKNLLDMGGGEEYDYILGDLRGMLKRSPGLFSAEERKNTAALLSLMTNARIMTAFEQWE